MYETVFQRCIQASPPPETEENGDAPPLCVDGRRLSIWKTGCPFYGIAGITVIGDTEPWDFVQRRVTEHSQDDGGRKNVSKMAGSSSRHR